MNGQGMKLLDFTGMIKYRMGEYYPVPLLIPRVKVKGKEVRGNAKE
jgi:hypothetical protein